jgi:hypothetical protein
MRGLGLALALVLGGALVGAFGASGEEPKLVKAGTVELEEFEAGMGLTDAVWGKGTVMALGQKKNFRLSGGGAGGIGGAKIVAHGTVYNLSDIGLFPGVYSQASLGGAAGDDSKSTAIWLRNTNGVVLELRGKQSGFAVTGGANGVLIQFEE